MANLSNNNEFYTLTQALKAAAVAVPAAATAINAAIAASPTLSYYGSAQYAALVQAEGALR